VVEHIVRAHGRSLDPEHADDEPHALCLDEPALGACYAITRPRLAQDRLPRLADGRIELTLKKAWRDGTRALVFEPHEIITRLIAAIPPPRFHVVRDFGALSSQSSLRAEIVPEPPADRTALARPAAAGDQLPLFDDGDDADARPSRSHPSTRVMRTRALHAFTPQALGLDARTCLPRRPRLLPALRWTHAGGSGNSAASIPEIQRFHVSNIFHKLEADSRADLLRLLL
jgi:hypothetical protein